LGFDDSSAPKQHISIKENNDILLQVPPHDCWSQNNTCTMYLF
jgi:hypothetical protein